MEAKTYPLVYEFDREKKHVIIFEARPEWTPGSRQTAGIMRKCSMQLGSRQPMPKDAGSFAGYRVRALIYKDLETLLKDEEIVEAPAEFRAMLEEKLKDKLPLLPVPELDLSVKDE